MTDVSRPGDPVWLREAAKLEGLREIIGSEHEPEILAFFADAGFAGIKDDETAWCAAFAGAMLVRSGYKPSGSLLARSYLTYGEAVTGAPLRGDIAVFKRGNSSWQGHVAFFLGFEGEYVVVLGGNQSNAVTVARYPKNKLLGFRRPTEGDQAARASAPSVAPVGGTYPADLVRMIQQALRDKGYHEVGQVDGSFGPKARGAIMTFQADRALPVDGRPSGDLLEQISRAPMRPVSTTRSEGVPADSRIVENSDKTRTIGLGLGTAGTIAAGREVVEQAEGGVELLQRVGNLLGPVATLFMDFWPVLLISAAVGVWWYASQAKQARIEDHRTGKTA